MPSIKIKNDSGNWVSIPYIVGGGGPVNSINGKSPDDSGNVALTAVDVGARPSTWVPSVSDIGAIASDAKGAAGGVAELDANALLPLDQIPDEAKGSLVVATIAERDAVENPFTGLSVYVKDATGDTDVLSGGAFYIYDGTAWKRITGGGSSSGSADSISWDAINDKPSITNTFNGRSGVVMPQSGDYTAEMVGADAAGSAAAVTSALNTHIADADVHISDEDRTAWDGKASPATEVAVILTAAGWVGEAAPYTQAVNVSGLKATGRQSNGMIGLSKIATAEARAAARAALISVTGQADGVLTVAADGAKPEVDIPSVVVVMD